MALPTGRNDLHRGIDQIGVFVPFQITQEGEGFEHGFPCLITRKLDRSQKRWEKATHRGIACNDFLVVIVIRWTCQLVNDGHGLSNLGLFFHKKRPYLFVRLLGGDDFLADLSEG
jgi:hypothetical protein